MKRNKVFLLLLVIFLHLFVDARPVHKSALTLLQPDGSSFLAVFQGDEFIRIKTTIDGHAIIQQDDGWWCYACYDENAVKSSTGVHVGEKCPPSILVQASRIPYRDLSASAALSREYLTESHDDIPLLRRIMETKSLMSRSGAEEDDKLVKHGIVLLAQFADLSFKHSREDFERLLNQDGYRDNGALGCAKEYFDAQLDARVEFSFDVSNIITLSRNLAYYGANTNGSNGVENDKAAAEMIAEACRLADADIDFAKYDDDGDGTVDNIFVFFAGGDEAEGAGDDCIWSHAWFLRKGAGINLNLDGKIIDRYACTSEMHRYVSQSGKIEQRLAGIGSFCHEYAHTFGLVDMYDTDYESSGGVSEALWSSTSLMDGGNMNNGGNTPPNMNVIEREMMGIIEPVLIETDGTYKMAPIHKSGTCYRINTDFDGEYYLLECRSQDSWDTYIGGSGMLVYHIDKSVRLAGYSDSYAMSLKAMQRWNYYNEVNCRPDHQCADLLEAFEQASGVGSVFFPQMNITEIPAERLRFWSGEHSPLSVTTITRDGENILFNIIGADEDTTPPEPVKLAYEKFQDAAILTFESNRLYEGEALVSWGKTSKDTETIKVKPYESGKYALVLEGLEPRTSYTVSVSFSINNVSGKEAAVSFLTNSYSGGYPYIYLRNVKRNDDSSFPPGSRLPLRVYNAPKAEKVQWFLNDSAIKVSSDAYYTLTKAGILKAVVSWEDGSEDVIIKEIKLSE